MPLLLAAFFLEVGFLLLVVPWSSFWDRNFFTQSWPPLQALLTNNFVRGAVSGLGILNVLAAVGEIARIFSSRQTGQPTPPTSEPPPDPRP